MAIKTAKSRAKPKRNYTPDYHKLWHAAKKRHANLYTTSLWREKHKQEQIERGIREATRELHGRIHRQRHALLILKRKHTETRGAIIKLRREKKRAQDMAARYLAKCNEREFALREVARLSYKEEFDEMWGVFPENIQLAIREEFEPNEVIAGSMGDVGLDIEDIEI